MKLLIASDIHGSAYYCRKMLEAYEKEGAQRMLLLGDILYHGPRNDLPKEYAPKEVIRMLNEKKNEIYAIRGNCEAEWIRWCCSFRCWQIYDTVCGRAGDLCDTRTCIQ